MSKVVLLVGGNQSGTREALQKALQAIDEEIGKVVYLSGLYTSPPWGFQHPNWFLNQALEIESTLRPQEILKKTQNIEKQLGRKKKTTTHYEGRLIDIDILFVENEIINCPELQIPHPRLHLRRFALLPLCEWMSEFIHPLLKKSILTLLFECPDSGEVRKLG
ncbi:2-amino-4-hydroxy-6-hydroxymethyldihydropteridine diphosphokinase [Thermophagus sp. OGC60D27]|uniref:2-amino-4-hydroxy-6- hydroxymethyldihydropteridine diphosphokinase n=1 Tax=Thermophagus sp. OGC60D27 TaxID=3458415 RepID=UPI004037B9C5